MKRFAILLAGAALTLVLASPGRAGDASRRLVFLGDSLTAGYGVLPGESMPGLIEARVKAAGLPFTVINAGVSDDTSAQALDRLDGVLSPPPDVLVIFLGANDGLQRLPVPALRRNLEKIIDRSRRANRRVSILLLGMRMPEEWGRYSHDFNEMYENLAYRRRTVILPWAMEGIIGQLDLTLADAFHPNAAGYRIMSERVWKALEPMLRKVANAR